MVATDVPGCREIAREGETALLVPVDDAPAIADALARLAGDAALRQRFGAQARKLVEGVFSAREVGRQTVALYDALARG
jgi:glycosyltransferase involved in cell wall biosynthesis